MGGFFGKSAENEIRPQTVQALFRVVGPKFQPQDVVNVANSGRDAWLASFLVYQGGKLFGWQ